MKNTKTIEHNESAWDKKVKDRASWTLPVTSEEIMQAKQGNLKVSLGGNIPTPTSWFPESLKDLKVLCLADGGGQQGPLFAAAGTDVTIPDFSAGQLKRDGEVAQRGNLELTPEKGDMADLSRFADESFDIVFCPVAINLHPNSGSILQ